MERGCAILVSVKVKGSQIHIHFGLNKSVPWKGKSFGRHELLDDGDDAGGGGVVQDGDGVHEVGQGAQEPPNPVKGRTLTKQLLQRGQMVDKFRKQMQEEEERGRKTKMKR